jgi:membrane protease YdiL (CAAX protease family)
MVETMARLKPLGWLGSILYFGTPCGLFSASILGLLPWMIRHGYSQIVTFFVTFGLPLLAMFVAAFVFYRLEGRPWTWLAFCQRMRLQRLSSGDWLWTVALVIVATVGGMVIGRAAQLFVGVQFYNPPPEFVIVMTGVRDGTFGGMAMHDRWDIFVLMAVTILILNIGGEELWWRGVVLPRQELAFGKWAWLVNGILWNLFHFFYHSNAASMVAYIPVTLPLAFVAQHTRNMWPGIVAHLIDNRAPLVVLFRAITR